MINQSSLLPDIQIFDFIEEGDFFVEHPDYKRVAEELGLGEWNNVVWIGRLFALDNDYGEHWFDNWELVEEKEELIKKLDYEESAIFMLNPERFKDGKDGPCNTDAFRRQFWTDVLRNLKLNLSTLIEKARQINEKNRASGFSREGYLEDFEDRVTNILEIYAPNSGILKRSKTVKSGRFEKHIKEIASELQIGMVCYLHKQTKEIESIPDFDTTGIDDTEPWQELIDKLDENFTDYWQFKQMSSREAFQIMEQFAEQLNDENLKQELYRALNRRSPFQNFKFVIDGSGKYREQWFAFRDGKYEEFVMEQMEEYARWENRGRDYR